MSVESAEITKLAINCFITSKIAFANLVADIADVTPGADKNAILAAVGKDLRIGSRCMKPGYGFGGPCFPRDNRALGNYAILRGIEPTIFRATDIANAQHADFMAQKFCQTGECTFEDVCYKPNCPVPIIEESQKLVVAKKMAERGVKVTIVDRENIIALVQKEYGDIFNYVIK